MKTRTIRDDISGKSFNWPSKIGDTSWTSTSEW